MAKKVKIMEACIITSDDKGQRSLVGRAKEALTTFSKNKIDVTIVLDKTPKEDAEKFLKENNVPYKELMTDDELRLRGFQRGAHLRRRGELARAEEKAVGETAVADDEFFHV